MNIYARPTLITPILAEVSPNLALPLSYLHCNKDLAFRLVSGLSLVLFGQHWGCFTVLFVFHKSLVHMKVCIRNANFHRSVLWRVEGLRFDV